MQLVATTSSPKFGASSACTTSRMAAFEEYWGIREKRVWAYEVPNCNSGLRRYFAASIQEFYAFYKHARCGRHYYEVIQEDLHCRPYFDLEFNKAENPGVDGQAMMEDFLAICTEAGERCVVQNRGVKDTFCDRGVYTRNRNFRLFHSSKVNKGVKLTLAPYCPFYGNEAPRSMQPIFLDSLVVPDGYWRRPLVDTRSFAPQPCRPLAASRWPIAGARGGSGHYSQFEHTIASGYDSLSPLPGGRQVRVAGDPQTLPAGRHPQLVPDPTAQRLAPAAVQGSSATSATARTSAASTRSQNVYWIANLKGYTIVQRCFDFDCAGFVSGELHFPEEVAESVYWTIDDTFDRYLKKRTGGSL
ncbi:DNA-directed primase/polymerase protein [Aphelenchoides fujianensis]|nr:DNA-directed primase/polymerase protein [Aphelenchoides fujianensis]